MQFGEGQCVKVLVALQEWSLQFRGSPNLRGRKHTGVCCTLQEKERVFGWSERDDV